MRFLFIFTLFSLFLTSCIEEKSNTQVIQETITQENKTQEVKKELTDIEQVEKFKNDIENQNIDLEDINCYSYKVELLQKYCINEKIKL
jgi:hypothetical protein